jgi:hypothetical protein
MKYEAPELTALAAAIDAIQNSGTKNEPPNADSSLPESGAAYADYE